MDFQSVSVGSVVSVTMDRLHATGIVVSNEQIEGAWVLTVQSPENFMVSVNWEKNPSVHLVAEHPDDLHTKEASG